MSDKEHADDEGRQEILRLLGEADSSTGILIVPTRRQGDIGIYDEGVDDLAKDLVRCGAVMQLNV